ncbi:MAG TPA: O-antigen ligase family protein [Actinomycetota bacterium]|nr:O-antigen ligase family protein [Actinomycetota bacterium]
MSPTGATRLLDRLPSAAPGPVARGLWALALVAVGAGIAAWATWTLQGGVIALWCFSVAAVALALALPLPLALASPLFMGVFGWLVDMLPFVILAGWATVIVRWGWRLWSERRSPRGGRWIWLPIGLVVWTALGVTQIDLSLDLKHFVLLLGIQVLSSGTLLMVVDQVDDLRGRSAMVAALVAFIVVMSVAVFAEWIGAPIQEMQNSDIRKRVEEVYGVDAFPNNLGMIKYARSSRGGAKEFRAELERFAEKNPDLPRFDVFLPKFQAFDTTNIVVRFDASARPFERELATVGRGVELRYDNIGLTPANSVPRMRSLSRNSLTYAGSCVALFFLSFYLFWTGAGRRKVLGLIGVVACLFGAGFSLARGAWVAIPFGIVYLLVDRLLPARHRVVVVGAFVAGAVVLSGVYLLKYGVDPISARAGGEASFGTRQSVYEDTIESVNGIHFLVGYGTETPRTASGVSHELGRYIPKAGTHSTYLNYLFRTGVPGALGIILVYALSVLHARAAAWSRAGDERVLDALLAAAVVAAAAHAVILSLYVEPIYTLIISALLGLAVAGGKDLGAPLLFWKRPTRDLSVTSP